MGRNSSHIQIPFLNLLGNIQQRAGGVHIRLGGNTQDSAQFADNLELGKMIEKDKSSLENPTQTPATRFTVDLFYMMSNISAMANVKWYLGIAFNDTSNWRLQMAEQGQAILGDNLLGLQAGYVKALSYAAHVRWF